MYENKKENVKLNMKFSLTFFGSIINVGVVKITSTFFGKNNALIFNT